MDAGSSFGPVQSDPALPDPGCGGSILSLPAATTGAVRTILFSNLNTTVHTDRSHITLKRSVDDAISWPSDKQTLLSSGPAGYSCLTSVPQPGMVGVLWETSAAEGSGVCVGPGCRIVFSLLRR